MVRRLGLIIALSVVFLGLDARAEKPGVTPYSGVTPEGGEPPTHKPPPAGFQYITWPGFRSSASGSEVFLQLTGPVTYKVKKRGNRVRITINKVMVQMKNNLRRVITRNFPGTPVSHFRVRKLKGDKMRLDIRLKRRARHTISLKRASQYYYLIVSFPPSR